MQLARATGWPPSVIKALTPYELYSLVAILGNEARERERQRAQQRA